MPVPKGVSKEKFDDCVDDVKAKQDDKVNAYAVCNASLGKSELTLEPGDSYRDLKKKEDLAKKAAPAKKPPQAQWAPPANLNAKPNFKMPEMNPNISGHKIPQKVKARFALKKEEIEKSDLILESGMSYRDLFNMAKAEDLKKPPSRPKNR